MNKGQINIAFLLLATLLSGGSASDVITENVVKNTTVQVDTTKNIISKYVPFYSQIRDISNPAWRGVSCGVASLAMVIDYYTESVAPDVLLQKGLASGAYNDQVGWYHSGLIKLAREYGLEGQTIHLGQNKQLALEKLKLELKTGPVMASVHYTFDYNNPIPHLVVITDIKNNVVHYNDPAENSGGGTISIDQFASSWKNRIIAIRPNTVATNNLNDQPRKTNQS